MHARKGQRKDIDREGDAKEIAAAQKVEAFRKGGQGKAAGDQVRHTAQCGEQGQRADETGDVEPVAELADRKANGEADAKCDANADDGGCRTAQRGGECPGEPGHDAAGKCCTRADRQVNLARDDHRRHAERDDAQQ